MDPQTIVGIARQAVDSETTCSSISIPSGPDDRNGIFVTIKKYPSGELRGCIGYIVSQFPLYETIMRSAISACHDPRFPALGEDEVDNVTIEVTVLTEPEIMDPADIPGGIVIGRDGLIIERRGNRGLLLPQVPVEYGWNVMEYLQHLCMKAGLEKDDWKSSRIYSFQGRIFAETSPRGTVIEVGND